MLTHNIKISYLYLFSSNTSITLKTLIFSLKWGQPISVFRTGKLSGLRVKTEKNYIWGFKYLLLWYSKAKFQVVPYFSEVPLTITGFQNNRKNQNEICSLAHNTFRKMLWYIYIVHKLLLMFPFLRGSLWTLHDLPSSSGKSSVPFEGISTRTRRRINVTTRHLWMKKMRKKELLWRS